MKGTAGWYLYDVILDLRFRPGDLASLDRTAVPPNARLTPPTFKSSVLRHDRPSLRAPMA